MNGASEYQENGKWSEGDSSRQVTHRVSLSMSSPVLMPMGIASELPLGEARERVNGPHHLSSYPLKQPCGNGTHVTMVQW